MACVTPVLEHWLEREIVQWVHFEGLIRWPIAPWLCLCPWPLFKPLKTFFIIWPNLQLLVYLRFNNIYIFNHSTHFLLILLASEIFLWNKISVLSSWDRSQSIRTSVGGLRPLGYLGAVLNLLIPFDPFFNFHFCYKNAHNHASPKHVVNNLSHMYPFGVGVSCHP